MPLTDIAALFSDIVETPQQRQQRLLAEGQASAGQFTGLPTGIRELAMGISSNIPRNVEAVRRFGVQAGLPMETQGEQLQGAMANFDIDDPNSRMAVLNQLKGIDPMRAVAFGEMLKEKDLQEAQLQRDLDDRELARELRQREFAMGQARDIQNIEESQQRVLTTIQNRLLAEQQRNQGLTAFEYEEKMNELNLEEAQIRVNRLKEGDSTDEIFGGQEILPNNIIYYASTSGDLIVKDINGNVLTGEDADAAMTEGFAKQIEQQKNIYQARRLGTEAALIASDAFKEIGTTRTMLSNLREAARLVEGGAATTDLEAFLSPLDQATNFLKQITGQLTLDQLSQVTMGALSEKELDLLQQTAAPRGFDKPAIIQWYRDKAAATEKALAVLEQQAIYFSQEGATPSGWIEMQREAAQPSDVSDPNDSDARQKVLDKIYDRTPSPERNETEDTASIDQAALREILMSGLN